MPIIGVLSVLWSIWLTASVFDLSDSLKDVFLVNFIDIPNVIRLSLQSIVMSASLWFLFHYINYLFKALTKRHFKQKTSNAGNRPNITLANNIIAILVWGAYLVIVMIMLKIPAGAIEIISAGQTIKMTPSQVKSMIADAQGQPFEKRLAKKGLTVKELLGILNFRKLYELGSVEKYWGFEII